jgi:GntR family transcriptional regulator, transcriptional repressor for pyruvate dehydrogenase complex
MTFARSSHEVILEALAAGDPERSRDAMAAHIDQTEADLRRYVLDADRADQQAGFRSAKRHDNHPQPV